MAANHQKRPETAAPDSGDPAPTSVLPGYRGDLAATLPPISLRELFAASGIALYVLTTDSDFATTVRSAAGEQYPLYIVGEWKQLLAAVESRECGVAILDANLLGSKRTAECLQALLPYAHRLVTLVAADRELAKELVVFASSRRIHRLLIKPVAVGATRLFIDSAVERSLQLGEQHHQEDAIPRAASRRASLAWIAAAVALTLAAVASLAWFAPWGQAPSTPGTAASMPKAAPGAGVDFEQRVTDLRARAELAFREGRLTEPPDDAALDHYLTLSSLVPGDADAARGIAAIEDRLFVIAETALLDQRFEAVAEVLDEIRRVDPASSRLAFLDVQLGRALASGAAAAAQLPPETDATAETINAPTELDSVLSLGTARLRRGELLTPAGDSARAYLDRAMRIDGSDARVIALRADVGAAMLAAARVLAGADVAAARALAAEARGLGVEATALAALERELGVASERAAGRQRVERLTLAQERIRQGVLFEPPEASALTELQSLQSEAQEVEGLTEAWDSFRLAVRESIETAIERGEWEGADAGLAALREAPGGTAVAAPLAQEIEARRLQLTYLAETAPAGELMLLSAPPAVYPPEAVQRGIVGWVDVEFVVDRMGATRDIVVTQSSPPQRFDAAALAAVSNYRYAPFERDGRQYERRVRLRLRFDLQ
jgi:TonB family protein